MQEQMLLKENFSEEYIRRLQKDSKRDSIKIGKIPIGQKKSYVWVFLKEHYNS